MKELKIEIRATLYVHTKIYIYTHLAGIIRDKYTFFLPMRFISKKIRKSNYFLLAQNPVIIAQQIDRISAKSSWSLIKLNYMSIIPYFLQWLLFSFDIFYDNIIYEYNLIRRDLNHLRNTSHYQCVCIYSKSI